MHDGKMLGGNSAFAHLGSGWTTKPFRRSARSAKAAY
jgi:hypothetical protein